ncbi:hypothetical protein GCM10011390_49320 [Aureimonas endophytica]|uniref:DUF805 domain-containing protein n=1 Tax=Aureimonas endophytica TaxID=2027858 RepID=A0A917A3J1_9HYPH|nr:DUF805 domain-containing protein [Aureimonas endophytica]GGE24051.1 hypothetical protein GCM10011390_49320 [Aureimonas endophytica]
MGFRRFFHFSGRAGRGEFWLAAVKASILTSLVGFAFHLFGWSVHGLHPAAIRLDGGGMTGFYAPTLAADSTADLVLSLFWLACILPAGIRRRHDRGDWGWDLVLIAAFNLIAKASHGFVGGGGIAEGLAFVILVSNLEMLVLLGFLPGERGGNAFGPDRQAESRAALDRAISA